VLKNLGPSAMAAHQNHNATLLQEWEAVWCNSPGARTSHLLIVVLRTRMRTDVMMRVDYGGGGGGILQRAVVALEFFRACGACPTCNTESTEDLKKRHDIICIEAKARV